MLDFPLLFSTLAMQELNCIHFQSIITMREIIKLQEDEIKHMKGLLKKYKVTAYV
jgi:uncharacterized protein (DUF305 family)